MGCGASAQPATSNVVRVQPKGKRPTLVELQEQHKSAGSTTPLFGEDKNNNPTLRSGASCLHVIENNSVLVAVRLRPLNKREVDLGSKECLECQGVTQLAVSNAEKKFAFDCIFRQDACQQDVFDRTARPLLHKVLEGFNGCMFAYGQTGSGKTWTMQGGNGAGERGVIPLLCAELYSEIENRSKTKTITVHASLLEIYNEQLNDLLVPGGSNDLKILEDSARGGRGMYVEGASEILVSSSDKILKMIDDGQARRAVGQTNMNERSSRSHSVFTLRVISKDVGDEEGMGATSSKFHLVDLAGSERQKATGATGDRLKEGAQINLSLSALGNVINALTEPKGKDGVSRHVPYRDSKLTRLLQDSLGGNSFTVMVCNISPAEVNKEETVSSLRFAERAKKIENKAIVNRDPKTERIAQLMAENKALQERVDRLEAYVKDLETHY